MMAQEKRIYILIGEVIQVYFLFCIAVVSKRNKKNKFFIFLSSYRNSRESLWELEKAVLKFPLVFLQLDRNMVHVFYFYNNDYMYYINGAPS